MPLTSGGVARVGSCLCVGAFQSRCKCLLASRVRRSWPEQSACKAWLAACKTLASMDMSPKLRNHGSILADGSSRGSGARQKTRLREMASKTKQRLREATSCKPCSQKLSRAPERPSRAYRARGSPTSPTAERWPPSLNQMLKIKRKGAAKLRRSRL